jgi:hypothetical protein
LHQRGVLTKLRQSAGQDVDGGCGQLRARAAPVQRHITIVPAAETIGHSPVPRGASIGEPHRLESP